MAAHAEGMAAVRERERIDRAVRRAAERERQVADLAERIEALSVGEYFTYTEGAGGNRKPEIERFADDWTVYYHVNERNFADARDAAEFVWNEGDDGEPYGWTGLGNGFER